MGAAHARAAAVMSLITSHGALLHAPTPEVPAAPAAPLAASSERDGQHMHSSSITMQDTATAATASGSEASAVPLSAEQGSSTEETAAAAAASGSEAGDVPSSAEQLTSKEEVVAAADEQSGEPGLGEPDIAAAEVQAHLPDNQSVPAEAQRGTLDGVNPPDSHDASSSGAPQQQKVSLQQTEREISMGNVEARQHCLMVSFPSAQWVTYMSLYAYWRSCFA